MDISAFLAARKDEFEEYLRGYLERIDAQSGLFEACAYSLRAGGKRIRPVLAMLSAEAVSGGHGVALDAGLAIEMIHTFSLIHDDLPAIDDDDLRRGVPTCHRRFGEACAILAGDALVFQALSVICRASYPDRVKLDLCASMVDACGMNGLVQGEYEDVTAEGRDLSLDAIEGIYEKKTSRLFSLSMYAGARAAGADEGSADRLSAYGTHLGMAFQAIDDILDVTADSRTLGKSSGKDSRRGKATLVRAVGLDAARKWAEDRTRRAAAALEGLGEGRARALGELAFWMLDRVM